MAPIGLTLFVVLVWGSIALVLAVLLYTIYVLRRDTVLNRLV
jgi:hypothetical protein